MKTVQTKRRARECRWRALSGGLALANAGLGAVHGFAGPLGGMLHAPHGALCARLLPLVMEANIRAMQSRQPEQPVPGRYAEIAQILTGDKSCNCARRCEVDKQTGKRFKNPPAFHLWNETGGVSRSRSEDAKGKQL